MTGPETVAAYRPMVTIREFENHAAQLRSRGMIVCSLHLGNGQEAIAVGARAALGPSDTVNATYRGHHWAIACGTRWRRCSASSWVARPASTAAAAAPGSSPIPTTGSWARTASSGPARRSAPGRRWRPATTAPAASR